MKAIVLNEYGDGSHLKLAEIPESMPGVGEIKVVQTPIAKRLQRPGARRGLLKRAVSVRSC